MAVSGLASACCFAALRQSCLVISLSSLSLGVHIGGGVARHDLSIVPPAATPKDEKFLAWAAERKFAVDRK